MCDNPAEDFRDKCVAPPLDVTSVNATDKPLEISSAHVEADGDE